MRYVVVGVLLLISLVVLELSNAMAPSVSYEWVVSYSERSILGANKQVPFMFAYLNAKIQFYKSLTIVYELGYSDQRHVSWTDP